VGSPEGRLLEQIVKRSEHGQLMLADSMRRFVHGASPELFHRLDFDDDAAFLEPLAFGCVTNGAGRAEELSLAFAGAIEPHRRPEALVGFADALGRLFLPGLGYLSGL
jgi:hypothetical protein